MNKSVGGGRINDDWMVAGGGSDGRMVVGGLNIDVDVVIGG